jgi:Uma2 family endonuclease
MAVTEQRLSLDEFLALPEKKPALEYEDGEVTQKVAPKGRHSALQTGIADLVNRLVKPGRLAFALTELRSTYARTSRVPDVSVYRWERLPRDARGRIADDFFEPPDVAIEIVSPGQRVNRLVRRCLSFVANGVGVALLVDPDDESVLLFRPNTPPVALRNADSIDLTDLVPGLRIRVQDIFAELDVL